MEKRSNNWLPENDLTSLIESYFSWMIYVFLKNSAKFINDY